MRVPTCLSAVIALISPWALLGPARAEALAEPPVFASQAGVLDLLMVAVPRPIPTIAFVPPGAAAPLHPTGWVYQVCPRPATGLACPAGSSTVSPYGGVRLALQQGDTLKVRYVNRLPKLDPLKLRHQTDPGEENLFLNPSNIHTHGLLTPARSATVKDPTFGDYVYVTVYNPDNGIPTPPTSHQHGPVVMDTIDYRIPIPSNHPSGLFWFHPHVHGIALNQVVQGLSGLITIGEVGDYVSEPRQAKPWAGANVRHMMLKEIQVLAAGQVQFDGGPLPVVDAEVLHQEDPGFCAQFAAPGETRRGSCPGVDNTADGGSNFSGGQWIMTVNGQQFPTIPLTNPDGEVWRLATGAASLSWNLQLVDDVNGTPLSVQVLAIDGVAVSLPQDTSSSTPVDFGGKGRFHAVPCHNAHVAAKRRPMCVDRFVMMPSSRVELWVTYRDAAGKVRPPPAGASATLQMAGLTMGSGDAWPAVDLAKVLFQQGGATASAAAPIDSVVVAGATDAAGLDAAGGILVAAAPGAKAAQPPANCKPLPAGHHRRVFFGFSDVTVNNTFAMGYEEVDRHGSVVPGSEQPAANQLERFDPSRTTVCLPLGAGQTPVSETWELIQLSTENHNFHAHQTRFAEVGSKNQLKQDNIPLGVTTPDPRIADQVFNNQNGVCTIDQWRAGLCVSTPVVLNIQFSQTGEFVYHCHILEHEDGGMMAKIRVVPAAN